MSAVIQNILVVSKGQQPPPPLSIRHPLPSCRTTPVYLFTTEELAREFLVFCVKVACRPRSQFVLRSHRTVITA